MKTTNTKHRRNFATLIAILALIIAGTTCLQAAEQVADSQQEILPTGKEIVERNIVASGGHEAYAKLENRTAKATVTMNPVGIKGKFTTCHTKSGNFRMRMEMEGMGVIDRGYNGQTFWEKNPMTGPRLIKGKELDMLLLLTQFDPSEYEDLYQKIECIGSETVSGTDCYKVKFTPNNIKEFTVWYSIESALEVKREMTVYNPMGEVEMEMRSYDYRDVDGIKIPFKVISRGFNMEEVVTLSRVVHNQELPENRFALPNEIKQLVARSEKKVSSR